MEEILSVKQLLDRNIIIPGYQRPYKWTIKNISELLQDIENAIDNSKKYNDYHYRLGTIILHKDADTYKIVDGQQRIISLTLLNLCLDADADFPFLNDTGFTSRTSKHNIKANYDYINDFINSKKSDSKESSFKEKVLLALSDLLQVVVITVNNAPLAFQLFDSQNTRGKALDPHDLLKAYHLREMKDFPYEMQHAVKKWESERPEDINKLFSKNLFPIYNWARNKKTVNFTVNQIDIYKGIQGTSSYNYARRAAKASPFFQIDEPFIAGNDFFEMTLHYLELYKDIKHKIFFDNNFSKIKFIIENQTKKSTGFNYALELFFCALLYYYDKFRNFDERAIHKLFIWAMMIRVDMRLLGFDTINNYAIGNENSSYSNSISIFSKIKAARLHNEISNLQINIKKPQKNAAWEDLFNELCDLTKGSKE